MYQTVQNKLQQSDSNKTQKLSAKSDPLELKIGWLNCLNVASMLSAQMYVSKPVAFSVPINTV